MAKKRKIAIAVYRSEKGYYAVLLWDTHKLDPQKQNRLEFCVRGKIRDEELPAFEQKVIFEGAMHGIRTILNLNN